ncbi:MAG: energy-coupling factor transporter transmembrane component T [Paracoccaceae bacterium]|jgi:biotin transport system permease protein|nr:energy-coupling factor transporter transmembrane component T [Paracoccaceae bacterium]
MLSLTSPIKTGFHSVPTGPKFALLMIASILLFINNNIVFQLLVSNVVLGLYLWPGTVFFSAGLKMLWPLWPFVLIVFLWHLFTKDMIAGVVIVLRMFSAVALANLVTMTSRMDDLIGLVTWAATPFRRAGLNPRILALSIALFIRFLPVFIERGGLLVESWHSRSIKRTSWRVVVPMALLALDDAETVAEALRARGGVDLIDD